MVAKVILGKRHNCTNTRKAIPVVIHDVTTAHPQKNCIYLLRIRPPTLNGIQCTTDYAEFTVHVIYRLLHFRSILPSNSYPCKRLIVDTNPCEIMDASIIIRDLPYMFLSRKTTGRSYLSATVTQRCHPFVIHRRLILPHEISRAHYTIFAPSVTSSNPRTK